MLTQFSPILPITFDQRLRVNTLYGADQLTCERGEGQRVRGERVITMAGRGDGGTFSAETAALPDIGIRRWDSGRRRKEEKKADGG